MKDKAVSSRPGYAFYRDVFGDWRWEYYDRDGEAIDSRDSFETREECVANAGAAGLGGAVVTLPVQHARDTGPGADNANGLEQRALPHRTRQVA